MCIFFDWVMGTQVVRRYIHLSGKDLDNALISINEGGQVKVEEEYKLKCVKCKRCAENISPTMNFCSRCALPVNLNNEYTRETELENENKMFEEKYEHDMNSMREEMNQQFAKIMCMIQQNPELANIKPEALTQKKINNKDN